MWEILANPQTPALTVLVILVFAFLGFLRFVFKSIRIMVDEVMEVAKHGSEVIEANSKIQGQVLERLRAANGHSKDKPTVEIGGDDRG